jgi:hypothetical protein
MNIREDARRDSSRLQKEPEFEQRSTKWSPEVLISMKIWAKNVISFQERTAPVTYEWQQPTIFHPSDETNAGCASSIRVQPKAGLP